ncbi:chemotaxis protein MotB [Limimonas halophila]|uniref:Chemotaxis protein MotB n=1 Tax=Limimonas halophila TaxID=1082479 RepID=A0A1G7P058_9PROT|nr:flagellar motor protein MotB [Limimonas halophila]SDF79614.1 chemotaxis protein MotB [Limimonas halophila]
MAEKDDNQPPIVIKKKKRGGEEEGHGGAWKVAYADFVTAMMAFFLLMWLLNATTEEQRSGIADYFSPVSASDSTSGGGGVLSGQTAAKDGALTSRTAPVGMNMQVPAAPPTSGSQSEGDEGGGSGEQGAEQLKQAELKIKEAIQQSADLQDLQEHVELERTDQGLRIRIMDRIEETMFEQGSAEPREKTRTLLREIADNISGSSNPLVIKGHTDATSFGDGATGYSNWELSSERANAARRILVEAGITADRIDQVVGAADQNLLLPDDPTDPRNRRISILLVRQERKTVAEEGPVSTPANGAATNGATNAGEGREPAGDETPPDGSQQPGGPSLFEDADGG